MTRLYFISCFIINTLPYQKNRIGKAHEFWSGAGVFLAVWECGCVLTVWVCFDCVGVQVCFWLYGVCFCCEEVRVCLWLCGCVDVSLAV